MIFVTIGMHPQGFERLIQKMDEIAGNTEEKVIMQIGGTKYIPRNVKYFEFVTEEEFKELCQKARVVVTHGAMTIIDALERGTPVVVVPRLKKYNEVIDDHQLDFTRELEKEGKVIAIYDVDELEKTLEEIGLNPVKINRDKKLVNALKKYIYGFEHN